MITLLILLILLGGWGGYGWSHAYQPGPYGGGGLVHLLVVLAVVVLCLRVLGVNGL